VTRVVAVDAGGPCEVPSVASIGAVSTITPAAPVAAWLGLVPKQHLTRRIERG